MIGPTGVGKTEISRRLAKLTSSPFLKIEASKFTEVGYVGRDVESMIRDLVRMSVDMVKAEKVEEIAEKAEGNVEERILDLLLPPPAVREDRRRGGGRRDSRRPGRSCGNSSGTGSWRTGRSRSRSRRRRRPPFEIFSNSGVEDIGIQIQEIIPGFLGGKSKKRKMKIREAREILLEEEEKRLVDMDQVSRLAIERVEHSGIIFLDEVDKIAGRETGPRARSQPRRRPARPPAHHRRDDRQHALRTRPDRPRPLHRRGRLPRLQAVRPHPRAPGAVPDPRRAHAPRQGGFRPHPDRAGERPHQAVPRP